MITLYYKSDQEVTQDTELQAWIKEVAEEGFVDVPQFGEFAKNKNEHAAEYTTLLSVIECHNT